MTAALEDMTKKGPEPSAEQRAAEELVRQAQEQGLSLTGPDGLLKQLTKTVIETALDQELAGYLRREKHAPGAGTGNVRNGSRPKTVLTESTGEVSIDVPRDRDGTFEPQIVKKRQRWLTWAGEIVLSLCAKGLTTGEISAHLAGIYGACVPDETVSRITVKVAEVMQCWQGRPLDEVYAAVFTDAVMVEARDGRAASRPVYAAIGVTVAGKKDVLGLWAGQGKGRRQVLGKRADRSEEQRDQGRVLRGLRRAEGPARGRGQRLAAGDRADLHRGSRRPADDPARAVHRPSPAVGGNSVVSAMLIM